jgi:hypothetical protein
VVAGAPGLRGLWVAVTALSILRALPLSLALLLLPLLPLLLLLWLPLWPLLALSLPLRHAVAVRGTTENRYRSAGHTAAPATRTNRAHRMRLNRIEAACACGSSCWGLPGVSSSC